VRPAAAPGAGGTPELGWGLLASHGGDGSGITQTGDAARGRAGSKLRADLLLGSQANYLDWG